MDYYRQGMTLAQAFDAWVLHLHQRGLTKAQIVELAVADHWNRTQAQRRVDRVIDDLGDVLHRFA